MDSLPYNAWLAGPLPEGVEAAIARICRTQGVAHVAVMPDVHLATEFCVGTAVASEECLFPGAVGGDIGCGMLALQFDADAAVLEDPQKAARLLGFLETMCPSRRHHRKLAPEWPGELRDAVPSHEQLRKDLHSSEALLQLGTLGAGNHFLEFQREQASGSLWLMIHTGSRGFGQRVYHHHLARARRADSGIMAIQSDTVEGGAYLADVRVGRAYARWNRRLLAIAAARAAELVLHASPNMETLVDCDHNHVQWESHAVGLTEPRGFFVHRKGATAAAEGQPGLIPGSMATHSFHTTGLGCARALCSSSHGAGREMSRTQARNGISRSAFRRQLQHVFYDARLEGKLLEEAPAAYKDIHAVMRAQGELTRIVRRLAPVLIYKGI